MDRDGTWVADWERGRMGRQEAEGRAWKTFAGDLTPEQAIEDFNSPESAANDVASEIRDMRPYDEEVDGESGIPQDVEALPAGHNGS